MAIKEIKGNAKSKPAAKPAPKQSGGTASKDEQIGFHKGALSTLAKEREEMLKILSVVEQLMQMHVAALKELGIDLEAMARKAQGAAPKGKSASLEKTLR